MLWADENSGRCVEQTTVREGIVVIDNDVWSNDPVNGSFRSANINMRVCGGSGEEEDIVTY